MAARSLLKALTVLTLSFAIAPTADAGWSWDIDSGWSWSVTNPVDDAEADCKTLLSDKTCDALRDDVDAIWVGAFFDGYMLTYDEEAEVYNTLVDDHRGLLSPTWYKSFDPIVADIMAEYLVGDDVKGGKNNDLQGGAFLGAEHDDRDGDGVSEFDGDCDDDDASIRPFAQEIPGNGIDEDCDGSDLTCEAIPAVRLEVEDLRANGAHGNDNLMYVDTDGQEIFAYNSFGTERFYYDAATNIRHSTRIVDASTDIDGLDLADMGLWASTELDYFEVSDMYTGWDWWQGFSQNGGAGDQRAYAGRALLQSGHHVVLDLADLDIEMGVWYAPPFGPGAEETGSIFGYATSTLGEDSDDDWADAMNTWDHDRILISFESFEPVVQGSRGYYDATLVLQPYHPNCDPGTIDDDLDGLADIFDASFR